MFCPQPVDWEATRLWIQTIASVIAGLGVVWTVWWTLRRHFNDQKWEQARQVYAYIHREDQKLELRLGNGSSVPVYDVFLYYFVSLTIPASGTWEKMEDQKDGILAVMENDVPIVQTLPPGNFSAEREVMGIKPGGHTDTSRFYAVEMVFRDASGNLWVRRASGKLEVAKKDPMDRPRFQNALKAVGLAPSLPYVLISPVKDE